MSAAVSAARAVKTFRAVMTPLEGKSSPNPFLPYKNPATGRWRPPTYSLRRQAELVKKAKAANIVALLPPGPKLRPAALAKVGPPALSAEEKAEPWARQITWEGKVEEKRKKDAASRLYANKKRMFKGHKWERVREDVIGYRKMLMRDMDKRIRRFKNTYRRKRPNPLKPPRMSKAQKLPF